MSPTFSGDPCPFLATDPLAGDLYLAKPEAPDIHASWGPKVKDGEEAVGLPLWEWGEGPLPTHQYFRGNFFLGNPD